MSYGSSRFLADLTARGLLWIADTFTAGPPCPGNAGVPSEFGIVHPPDADDTHDVETHKAAFAAQASEALRLRSVLHSINCHTGRDYFTAAEADDLLTFCLAFEREHGVTVHHETHRARILYSPWVAKEVRQACARRSVLSARPRGARAAPSAASSMHLAVHHRPSVPPLTLRRSLRATLT